MNLRSDSVRFWHKTDIDDIIALCHIIKDYDAFYKRVKDNLTCRFLDSLERFSKGKKGSVSKKVKGFYNSNKKAIDIINKFSSITMFINRNYTNYSIEEGYTSYKECKEFNFIRTYIQKHKDKINEILILLEKLKELGFKELYFDETLDFSIKDYYLPLNEFGCIDIDFADNISVIPEYKTRGVSYKINNSPYLIGLRINFNISSNDILPVLPMSILLNSLIFDPKELPDSITKENTFGKITALAKEKEQVSVAITNSVNFGVGILGLNEAYQILCNMVDNIKSGDETFDASREKIKDLLSQLGSGITFLQQESDAYNSGVANKFPEITPDVLASEVKRYLKRREDAKYHLH